MIDFSKKILNTLEFLTPAITFQLTGAYCSVPKGTSEYFAYWDEETRRCIEGYTSPSGEYITGYHYFYLNYCLIQRIVHTEVTDKNGHIRRVKKRIYEFPDFYDYDYYYFHAVQEAEELGKHLCVAKARRKGFSYKGAAMLCRNFFLIPGSKSYVFASNKQYLTEDGILTKAWEFLDFIDEHTAWGKKRQVVNTNMHRRASFLSTDEYGNKIEVGYKSDIIGVSLKDNPNAARGKAAKLILFEEAGSFRELKAAWQIVRPSVEQDGVAFGLMVQFGTGGDLGENVAGLRDAFYKPQEFNCLPFQNIWDEGASGSECGFFVPLHTNLDLRDENGNRLYMDQYGNTDHAKAKLYILDLRLKELEHASSSDTIDRYVAEHSECPMEAFMEFSGNIFPKKELLVHLATIRTNKKLQNHKQVGDLVWEDLGTLRWDIKKSGDITEYPLPKEADPTGAIVIWEHPRPDSPLGMYIIGVDPYDHDQSGTNSLGSAFVYKRFLVLEDYYDIIVAEYTGRPETAELYYENLRKLAVYYNARIMYENERKGLFPYFTSKHCDYLLADQPDIISDIISGKSVVNRRKGCHMTKEIKLWGEGLIKEWLNEEISPGVKRLTTILSEPLLEELIRYNSKYNADRVMALMQVMIYKELLVNLAVKEKLKEIKKNVLFDKPLFTKEWFDQ